MLLTTAQVTGQTSVGPFEKQRRAFNPLREPIDRYFLPVPHVVDFDGDNDFDLLVGSVGGDVKLFINEGGPAAPRFSPASELGTNPLAGVFVGLNSSPAMFDYDRDGDLDLFVGSNGSKIRYYRNNSGVFAEQTGPWNPTTKDGNPFDAFNNVQGARISFVDFDNNLGTGIQVFVGGAAFSPFPQFRHYRDSGPALLQESFALPGLINTLVQPTFAFGDLDGDGDKDAVVGTADGGILLYLKNSGNNTTFTEETGANNPFGSFFFEQHATPQLVDWDNDGDLDAIVGESILDDPKTPQNETSGQIHYYENTGSPSVPNFIPRFGLANPLAGISTESNGRVAIGDFLNNGTQIVMASGVYLDAFEEGYVSPLRFYSLNGGDVQPIPSPYSSLLGSGELPYPIDFDKDGDMDLFTIGDGFSRYYAYNQATGTYTPPSGHPLTTLPDLPPLEYPIVFTDLDNDNDWDIAYYNGSGGFQYLKNTGTVASPSFVLAGGADNLLAGLPAPNGSGIQFIDVDGDGDLDAFTDSIDPDQVFFHENTGTAASPVFGPAIDLFPGLREMHARTSFFDYDGDGDLDVLAGTADGIFKYLVNTNPAPQAVPGEETEFQGGSPGFVSISPDLTLTDADGDFILRATVQISPYEPGKDVFAFSAPAGSGISGTFDATLGQFTLMGKASVAVYQEALRAIRYRYTGTTAGGRSALGRAKNLNKTFAFSVVDADRTIANAGNQAATIVFSTNQVPTISASLTSVLRGQSAVVAVMFNDPDGNLDLSTLRVVTPPPSGAQIRFSNGNIVVDYTGLTFVGTENFVIEVCDLLGACAQAPIAVQVFSNDPPVIDASQAIAVLGQRTVISITVSDPDNNLDLSSFRLVTPPPSGAQVRFINGSIEVDYAGLSFVGTERFVIEFCDVLGACAQATLTVTVQGELAVFNGLSADGNELNAFLFIQNIEAVEPQNRVSVYSRWGDKVFEVENYDNAARRFEGLSDQGKKLPAGTYYYKVEFRSGREVLSGYLYLKN